jgi:hypothetical protein
MNAKALDGLAFEISLRRVLDRDEFCLYYLPSCMAHSLGISTVAKGVETEEQIAFLRGCGCNAVQGFYFSKPVPADEFARLARGANGPPGRPGERPVSFQHGTAPGKTLPAEYGILSRFGYPYSADGDG